MKDFGKTLSAVSLLLVVCALAVGCYRDTRLSVDKNGKTVVERYGQLQVKGTQLLNSAGKPIQLRGISSFALQYGAKYANETVIGMASRRLEYTGLARRFGTA